MTKLNLAEQGLFGLLDQEQFSLRLVFVACWFGRAVLRNCHLSWLNKDHNVAIIFFCQAMSGIKVNDNVWEHFNGFKMREKNTKSIRTLFTCKIRDNKEVVFDKEVDEFKGDEHEEKNFMEAYGQYCQNMLKTLDLDEPQFIFLKVFFIKKDGSETDKVVCIFW